MCLLLMFWLFTFKVELRVRLYILNNCNIDSGHISRKINIALIQASHSAKMMFKSINFNEFGALIIPDTS